MKSYTITGILIGLIIGTIISYLLLPEIIKMFVGFGTYISELPKLFIKHSHSILKDPTIKNEIIRTFILSVSISGIIGAIIGSNLRKKS